MMQNVFLKKYLFFSRLSILDQYIVKQFAGPFLLAVGGFVIIGIVDILFTLVDMVVNSGAPFFTIFRLLIYKIPFIMVLFFPMAVLFSVMLMLVRMAKDNEITVLRASGVHAGRIIAPIFIVVFVTSILSYYINEQVVPWADRVSNNLIREVIRKKPPPTIVENEFFKDAGSRYFYVHSIDKRKGIINRILIYEVVGDFPRFISAQKGYWNEKTWTLVDGFIQEFNPEGLAENVTHFNTMAIHVGRDVESFYTRQKAPREMDSAELKKKINFFKKGGLGTRNLRVEYYMKQSTPAACFIFGLIGIAFCFGFVRSGKDWWGVIWAVCLAVLLVGFFFFLMAVCKAFGKGGILPPFLGAWLPNIIYGTFSMIGIIYQSYFR